MLELSIEILSHSVGTITVSSGASNSPRRRRTRGNGMSTSAASWLGSVCGAPLPRAYTRSYVLERLLGRTGTLARLVFRYAGTGRSAHLRR